MSTPALNPLVTKIRGMHPGTYDDMDDATLTKAVLAKYPQYSDLATPGGDVNNPAASVPNPAPKGTLPNGGDTGEGPIAQGLTTFERKFSDIPSSVASSLHGPALGPNKRLANLENIPSPIATDEGSLPMNIGATAANLLPLAVDARGGGIVDSPIGAVTDAPVGRIVRTAFKAGKGLVEDVPGVRQAGKIAKYWKETEPAGIYPGASQPEAPAPQLLQGRALAEGPQQTDNMSAGPAALRQIPARGSLPAGFEPAGPEYQPPLGTASNPVRGSIARQMKEAAPAKLPAGFEPAGPQYQPPTGSVDNPATGGIPRGFVAEAMKQPPIMRPSLRQMMDSLNEPLNESVGAAPPPAPNKPIYQRGGVAEMMKQPPTDIPEGHTAIDSSALKSYKYDSATNEFHARYRSGAMDHVFGDVSPAEAQAFEAAPSKGKAMAAIQQNHPLVAKIVDGKRITVKGRP